MVRVSYGDTNSEGENNGSLNPVPVKTVKPSGKLIEIATPLEGTFYLTKEVGEKALKVGDKVNEGDTVFYIESMKTYNAIVAEEAGEVVEICVNNGDSVDEEDIIIKLQ